MVDLGCGIGADALALLDAGLEVVAVEADPETAAIAQANLGDRAEVLVGDAVELAPSLLGPGRRGVRRSGTPDRPGSELADGGPEPTVVLRRDVAGR